MKELHLIAHNIRSIENVGSLFRICDSLGVVKLWLTGYTAAPPDARISKVALGAERSVTFEHRTDVLEVMTELTEDGVHVFALENVEISENLENFSAPNRMALLLGTETTGIPASLIERCEGAVKITQRGQKESLNVSVAAGIACWAILR